MRLSTCARTDTSRALTGSSATQDPRPRRERPGDRDALALAAGELVRVAAGGRRRGRPTASSSSATRAPRSPVARLGHERLGDDVADAHARVERAHRVLEHHLHARPQEAQLGARGRR